MASTVAAIANALLQNQSAGTFTVDSGTAGAQRKFDANIPNIVDHLHDGEVYMCLKDTQTHDPILVLVGACAMTPLKDEKGLPQKKTNFVK